MMKLSKLYKKKIMTYHKSYNKVTQHKYNYRRMHSVNNSILLNQCLMKNHKNNNRISSDYHPNNPKNKHHSLPSLMYSIITNN